MTEPDDKYILIEGNPLDGYNFYGPFKDEAAAIAYAGRDPEDTDWWVADLLEPVPPEDEDGETFITVLTPKE
jgi:hypothetical protein